MTNFGIRNSSSRSPRFSGPGSTVAPAMGVFAILLLLLGSAAAWITHVIVCIHHASWVLLAFGCIVAPVGVIHGVGVWLGVFG